MSINSISFTPVLTFALSNSTMVTVAEDVGRIDICVEFVSGFFISPVTISLETQPNTAEGITHNF